MSRIIAIDYGLKRCGLAVTDPFQIIATALETVPNSELVAYLKKYFVQEKVERIVLGMPVDLKGNDTDLTAAVREFLEVIKKEFPEQKIHLIDERFTSKIALQSMIQSGTTKKDRREKGNIDKVSATLILQDFMSRQR